MVIEKQRKMKAIIKRNLNLKAWLTNWPTYHFNSIFFIW